MFLQTKVTPLGSEFRLIHISPGPAQWRADHWALTSRSSPFACRSTVAAPEIARTAMSAATPKSGQADPVPKTPSAARMTATLLECTAPRIRVINPCSVCLPALHDQAGPLRVFKAPRTSRRLPCAAAHACCQRSVQALVRLSSAPRQGKKRLRNLISCRSETARWRQEIRRTSSGNAQFSGHSNSGSSDIGDSQQEKESAE